MITVHKDREPEETIQLARQSLNELGIFPEEVAWNEFTEHNLSVRIADPSYPVGTNGKGVTRSYALASAYAEFMERLQNGFLIDQSYGLMPIEGPLFPDQQPRSTRVFFEEQKQIFQYLVNVDEEQLTEIVGETMTGAPFFNLASGQVEYLPINLIHNICGSNGMCAGNTPTEAITQGICEILERYARKQVYLAGWPAPSISLAKLESTSVFQMIEELQGSGFGVLVKDCTLGGRIPVLATAIFNRERSQYRMAFGADPIFEVALQRCLTEAVQGLTAESALQDRMLVDFDLSEAPFKEPQSRLCELYKANTDGSGRCPPSFFFSNSDPNLGSAFQEAYQGSEKALAHVLHLVHLLGRPVYLRDVSYFSFPTYIVYIPGLSELRIYNQQVLRMSVQEIPFIRRCLLNLRRASDADLQRCLDSLKVLRETPELGFIYQTKIGTSFVRWLTRVSLKYGSDFNGLQNEYLLALISHRVGDFEGAFQYLNAYLGKMEVQAQLTNLPYGMASLTYLHLRCKGVEGQTIRSNLADLYGAEMAEEAISDLQDPRDSFKGLRLPACGFCPLCPVNPDCRYGKWKEIVSCMRAAMQSNPIEQNGLQDLSLPY